VSLPLPPLLVITDRSQARAPLVPIASALFGGGCRWLSLREKDLPAPERLALLKDLIAAATPYRATITVHDDIDAALDAGAAGVHLPADVSVAEARRRLGPRALIGQSAHRAADIARAAGEGADYVTLSPIFLSASKPGYGPALGLDVLRVPAPLPVIALGGIGADNARACLDAGAAGVATMGGAMSARDPSHYIADLLAAMAVSIVG
jgi:thiamine-phosphate pyrophosphorylase